MVFLPHYALVALHDALLNPPFRPLSQSCGFIRAVRRSQSSHALVDRSHLISPEGFIPDPATLYLVQPACHCGCPGCGRCACYSYGEPQVRVECQVGTKTGRAVLKRTWQTLPAEVLSLPDTPYM